MSAIPAGYKQTEVGVIPVDWPVQQLGDIAIIATGNTPPTRDVTNYGDEFLFVSPTDLGVGKQVIDTQKRLSTKGFTLSRCFPKESILFVCIGSTIGKCGIASIDLTTNQQINAIFPSSSFSTDYLYYSVCAAAPRIRSLAGEQAVPIVNKTQFSETQVPLPPLPEQRAIAAALSDVDALLAKLDQFIAKKRDLKQAAMQQLLTGQTRLPGFSGAWEMKPVSSFSAFVTKGATPTTYGFNWVGDGVIFLRSECVSADGLDLTQSMFISEGAHAALLRGEVRAGDILMTITGNVGRVVRLSSDFGVANINQHIARIRVKDPNVFSDFIFHWLSQLSVRANYSLITTGQAYPQISLKQVRDTLIPLPIFDEQTAIATVLADMDAELTALEARRDKTRALKQGMMQELLTGRIRLV
ncbi:MAG: restriction endonuclease subunit S [Rhodocyclaceae bacterium]|nr:restriction endonuclease subunit S [Rhodocyclaceae bacterium]